MQTSPKAPARKAPPRKTSKKAPARRPKARSSSPEGTKPSGGGLSFQGRIIGIDLGLANTAAAVIEGGLGDEHVLALDFLPTDPDHGLRQMSDDNRRVVLIEDWLAGVLGRWLKPHAHNVIRYEWFAPRFNMKRGWTTSIVVGAVGAVSRALARHSMASEGSTVEALPASPPLHVQVAVAPVGHRISKRALPHVLDALTHARLEWLRRTEGR